MSKYLDKLSIVKNSLSREILTDSFKTALFVGVILNIINNGSTYSYGEEISGSNILFNFAVPFFVSIYSGARAAHIACGATLKKSNAIAASKITTII